MITNVSQRTYNLTQEQISKFISQGFEIGYQQAQDELIPFSMVIKIKDIETGEVIDSCTFNSGMRWTPLNDKIKGVYLEAS